MTAAEGSTIERDDLVRLAVAVVLHDRAMLAEFARAHGGDAVEDAGLRETLLQCHLFCGVPGTVAALDALREAGLALAPAPPSERSTEERRAEGAELFDEIYGDGADAVRGHLAELESTFAGWVAEHAYGRVLARPGLDARTRELIAVACLAATGYDRQLASHARGAVRCGASPDDVAHVIEVIGPTLGPDRLNRAREIVTLFARAE
ncbi:MAG: carboxymuconolactone decarboxylase family protein [Planctomycetota bacterium]|nr:carboxymuconolactone decarboxylase family protein [Planctomycetota bacterium]